MGSPSKDPRSIVLDCCWVCNARFVGNGGTEQRHDHHIFPQAYGGVDGPTVTLCDTHHSKVHRIAECLINEKTYHQWLKGELSGRPSKLLYLATRIHQMWLLVKDDPNKATSVALTLNAANQKMIDALKPVLNVRSREAVLIKALETLYARHFVQ